MSDCRSPSSQLELRPEELKLGAPLPPWNSAPAMAFEPTRFDGLQRHRCCQGFYGGALGFAVYVLRMEADGVSCMLL